MSWYALGARVHEYIRGAGVTLAGWVHCVMLIDGCCKRETRGSAC
ncbi:MAG: hypothetical protein WCK53_14015 [Methanomicrobiales archaeon]